MKAKLGTAMNPVVLEDYCRADYGLNPSFYASGCALEAAFPDRPRRDLLLAQAALALRIVGAWERQGRTTASREEWTQHYKMDRRCALASGADSVHFV